MGGLKRAWAVVVDIVNGLIDHEAATFASTIAFSLIFAIPPFVIFLVSLGVTVTGDQITAELRELLFAALPDHVVATIGPEIEAVLEARGSKGLLTFGVLVTLISITGAIEALRVGLNRAYGCRETRSFVVNRLHGLFFVFIGSLALLVVTALAIAAPLAFSFAKPYLPSLQSYEWIFGLGRRVIIYLVITGVLFAFHRFLPQHRKDLHWSALLPGIVVTMVLWWISGWAFGLYLDEIGNYAATYAGLAGIIAVMLFLNIAAIMFLVGAEVNRAIAALRGDPSICGDSNDRRS